MDEIFKFLIQGELTFKGFLLFIIFCLMKGWLVPFWQVQEMKDKLKAYDEKAPNLMNTMNRLSDILEEENEREKEHTVESPYEIIRRPTKKANPRRKPPHKREDT